MVSHHSCTPPWPSQLRGMQVSSPLLNITLPHSCATGDSLGHNRVWCGVFRTNIAQNHKLINNFHKRNSKLWQQIGFCTQCDHWKIHGDKWTWEIMKLMTQCVSVLCCWVDWHWLWGIAPGDAVDGSRSQTHANSNSTLLHYLTGKCKHFMCNIYRGWTGIIRKIS